MKRVRPLTGKYSQSTSSLQLKTCQSPRPQTALQQPHLLSPHFTNPPAADKESQQLEDNFIQIRNRSLLNKQNAFLARQYQNSTVASSIRPSSAFSLIEDLSQQPRPNPAEQDEDRLPKFTKIGQSTVPLCITQQDLSAQKQFM